MGVRKSHYHTYKKNKASKAQRKLQVVNNYEEPTTSSQRCFIDPREYNEINNHELCLERVQLEKTSASGNRIVDLNYIIDWVLPLQSVHSQKCTGGKLYLFREQSRGLGFIKQLIFKCTMCDDIIRKYTEDPNKKSIINYGSVWGTLTCGATYNQLAEICSAMDVPPISFDFFKKVEGALGQSWKNSLTDDIEMAGKMEREIAIRKGQIDEDGVPYTTVYCDGGWSKRSYGHSYNATSGIAVIIGKETNKVLFVGVRNKYCMICTKAANNQKLPKEHTCFKNWSQSSSAMEADILVEGFKTSITMHGLRYKKFIADGDSSVFSKIRENVSYGRYVEKVECVNHVLKNYGKSLFALKKDNKISSAGRKLLTNNAIKNLQNDVKKSIYANTEKDIEILKEDLGKNISNVFGSKESLLIETGIYQHMRYELDRVILKAHKLKDCETNNYSEMFMALVAKFNAGKRLNLTSRGSFNIRSYLSAMQYNKKHKWQMESYKQFFNRSIGSSMNRRILRKEKNNNLERKKHKKEKKTHEKNLDYGPRASKPELSSEEMASEIERHLSRLNLNAKEIEDLQKKSIGQFGNPIYEAARRDRLTASYFGNVVKRKSTTTSNCLAENILYATHKEDASPAIIFGRKNEAVAIKLLEKKIGKEVMPSGLFVDSQNGYLAATPDGLVGADAVVEVKCLYNVHKSGQTLAEYIRDKKLICLELTEGKIQLKRNHNYYYQIQGQLNISGRQFCYFVAYRGDEHDVHIEIIEKNTELWRNFMLPKLKKFYLEDLLPKIINTKNS